MIAYTFYWIDEREKVHFVGLLPERRKKTERITQESIINYGKTILSDDADPYSLFYIQVTLDEKTGEVFWTGPSVKPMEAA